MAVIITRSIVFWPWKVNEANIWIKIWINANCLPRLIWLWWPPGSCGCDCPPDRRRGCAHLERIRILVANTWPWWAPIGSRNSKPFWNLLFVRLSASQHFNSNNFRKCHQSNWFGGGKIEMRRPPITKLRSKLAASGRSYYSKWQLSFLSLSGHVM